MTVSAEELVEALRGAVASPVREYVVVWARVTSHGFGAPEIAYLAKRVRAYDVRDVIQDWMGRFYPEALVPRSPTPPAGRRVGDTAHRLLRVVPFERTLHDEIPASGEEWPWKKERDVL